MPLRDDDVCYGGSVTSLAERVMVWSKEVLRIFAGSHDLRYLFEARYAVLTITHAIPVE